MSVIHERTNTSRQTREIEDALAKKLDGIAKLIEKQGGIDLASFQQKYGNLVFATIEQAVFSIYLAGARYVGSFNDLPAVLNPNNLRTIQMQTQERVDAFWRAITRTVLRASDPSRPNFDRTAMMAALASVTATSALNVATIEKAYEQDDTAIVTWITSVDEKVCPICRPLHGKQWHIGDPTLLVPPDDSHINCRCRLLFKDGSEVYSH